MTTVRQLSVLLLLFAKFDFVVGIEPLTTVLGISAVTVAGLSFLGKPFYCHFRECCNDRWIKPQLHDLKAQLELQVYGQHLAITTAVAALRGHLKYRPSKALVLSLQGWTGTGKNLMSKVIAEQMYRKGMKSEYVHLLSATKHFSQHEHVDKYKAQLRDWVTRNMTTCQRRLFIFDEVEKMPDGLLSVLAPYMKHYDNLEGIDYRNAIFLLIGNAGAKYLSSKALEHYAAGLKREELQLNDTETVLYKEAYNQDGGLKGSGLISSNLISHYIPFLPLEKSHVRRCIEDDLHLKNVTLEVRSRETFDKLVDSVMSQLSFGPPQAELYSLSGCKRVFEKVNYVLEREFYEQ